MPSTDDVVAITQILHLYGHVLDGRRWERLPDIFTDDGVFDMSLEVGTDVAGLKLEGIPAIIKSFSTIQHAKAHHVSNVFVYESAGEMRSLCKVFMPDNKGRFHTGEYSDHFVMTTVGWRIRHRSILERRYWDSEMRPWTFLDATEGASIADLTNGRP